MVRGKIARKFNISSGLKIEKCPHLLQNKVQDFVNQVCAKEDWKTPTVEIPSEKDWYQIAIQRIEEPGITPKEIKGFSSPIAEKIIINPRFVNRTTILHELSHYNMPEEEILKILKEKRPKLLIEMRVESKARKLVKKYRDEWIQKVVT